MEKPRVKCEIRDGIAEVMLARGDKLNALDRSMFGAIDQTLAELQQHKGLRAVILYGEGRAFCAGLDVKSMLKQPVAALDILKREADEATNLAQRVAYGWHQLPVPVIAVTQGVCFGGGLQIALGADFRFSTPDCRFSVMEIKWGIIPDMSGCVTLRNLMGVDTAMELAMSGRECDALEAKSLGLALLTKSEPGSLSPSSLCHSVDQLPDWHSKHRHFVHRLHPCQRFTDLRIVISQAQFRADELFETIHRCLGF